MHWQLQNAHFDSDHAWRYTTKGWPNKSETKTKRARLLSVFIHCYLPICTGICWLVFSASWEMANTSIEYCCRTNDMQPEKKKNTQVRLLIVHSIATAYTCAKSRREKVFIPVIAATNCKATRRYKVLISVDFLVSFEFSFGRTHRFLEYFALHTQRRQRVCASLVHSRQNICANCC